MWKKGVTAVVLGVTLWAPAGQPVARVQAKAGAESAQGQGLTLAVAPKPLSGQVEKGLKWLVDHQLANGGWGQGDEAPNMRSSNQAAQGQANVADTSMALLALVRAGNSPTEGPYRDNVRRGLAYVLSEIESADKASLYVTSTRGTRVQSKIGTYVDTFAALNLLNEVHDTYGTKKENARLDDALTKVLGKIDRNQRADGSFGNRGWAPVLSQSLASKGLNKAAQAGRGVAAPVLERAEALAQSRQRADGSFEADGSAGVGLYAGAANTSALRDSSQTRKQKKRDLERKAASGDAADRRAAQQELAQAERVEQAAKSAEDALLGKLRDPRFVAGFGSNGGEEFLSYMLVSESLVVQGGDKWQRWDQSMAKLMKKVQNGDGSWTGHHCITGRTFCTSAALLVLMADRVRVPVASKLKGA